MTLIDFIVECPLLLKVILSIYGIYLIIWFPMIIRVLKYVIKNIQENNKNEEKILNLLNNNFSNVNNTKMTADLLTSILSEKTKRNNKSNRKVND